MRGLVSFVMGLLTAPVLIFIYVVTAPRIGVWMICDCGYETPHYGYLWRARLRFRWHRLTICPLPAVVA